MYNLEVIETRSTDINTDMNRSVYFHMDMSERSDMKLVRERNPKFLNMIMLHAALLDAFISFLVTAWSEAQFKSIY